MPDLYLQNLVRKKFFFNVNELSIAEKVFYWTAIFTPIWWLLGIQQLFYPVLVTVLLTLVIDYDKLFRANIPISIWAWLMMSLVMLWTAIVGINDIGFNFRSVAATLVTFIKSYFLIFACLAVPFFSRVRVKIITRAVSLMTIEMLINIAIQMCLLMIGINNLKFAPPFAKLIPGDVPSSLMIQSPKIAYFFNILFPRTVLHTADPPILGACALFCFVICLEENNMVLRRLSIVGSLSALFISFSRSAWLGLPGFLLILYLFRSQIIIQISLWLTTITFLICSLFELTLGKLLIKPLELFNNARAESSSTRDLVVSETLKAWQEKPWLGWGVHRGKAWLYEDTYITLGSFSTYAAVLYLNGIVGFVIFILALALTLIFFYKPAIDGNILCQRAFSILIIFYVLIQATPLSWMAIYLWFFFVWLGAIMKETQDSNNSISNWQQLAKSYKT